VVRESNGGSISATSTVTPRRRRRHDARRDGILRAAARMFRDRGFAETGMRDIAGAADLSAANLSTRESDMARKSVGPQAAGFADKYRRTLIPLATRAP